MSLALTMKVKEARAAILREWFALAPDQRATPSQAAQFADKMMLAKGISPDDQAGETIRGWLVRYTGLNPIF